MLHKTFPTSISAFLPNYMTDCCVHKCYMHCTCNYLFASNVSTKVHVTSLPNIIIPCRIHTTNTYNKNCTQLATEVLYYVNVTPCILLCHLTSSHTYLKDAHYLIIHSYSFQNVEIV
ncbi:hypothetical protein FKM82_031067 [Ascaphus truei]